jgi:hypothetical protein
MKLKCVTLLVAGLLGTGAAFAQTCGTPGTWTPDTTGQPTVSADTCTSPDDVALYCNILDSQGKGDAVWSITLADTRTATSIAVTGAAAGFNPTAYLYTGACAAGGGCQQTGSVGSNVPLSTAQAPSGTYFLAASAAAADGVGACGTVTLAADGTFPVSLQNFSVE